MRPRQMCRPDRMCRRPLRGSAAIPVRGRPFQSCLKGRLGKRIRNLRNRNERRDRPTSGFDGTAGGEEAFAALADCRRNFCRDCGWVGRDPAGRVLSGLPGRLHVLAGHCARFHGDSDDPPPHRGRLGNGDSPHPGCGHAYASSARGPLHSSDFRHAAALHLREHLEQLTQSYLTVNGFIVRAVFYFAIWNLLSFLLSMWSKQSDSANSPDNSEKFKAVSGPGLILYGFTISFAAIDWVMSLDPSWISTIFGLIVLIGEVLSAMCFAVVVERILVDYKPMSEMLKPDFVHDHGKWMLAFTMVWAYFNFSQWLIIWAGNLPSEITFYLKRLSGGWGSIGLMLVLFHFVIPFAMLLSRPFKRNIRKLVWVAVLLLVMGSVDLFWIIEPNFSPVLAVTLA